MHAVGLALAASLVGVDFGWQPTADGSLEYVIQIEPELLSALRDGEEIVSLIPRQLESVRKFRIRVGSGPLPRKMGRVSPTLGAAKSKRAEPPAGQQRGSERSIVSRPPSSRGAADAERSAAVASSADEMSAADDDLEPVGGAVTRALLAAAPTPAVTPPAAEWPPRRKMQPATTTLRRPDHMELISPDEMAAPLAGGPPALAGDGSAAPRLLPAGDSGERLGPSGVALAAPQTTGPGSGAIHSPAVRPAANVTRPATDPAGGQKAGSPTASEKAVVSDSSSDRPWLPLTLVALGLFLSLGGNLYLGWIYLDARRRCQRLLSSGETEPSGGDKSGSP